MNTSLFIGSYRGAISPTVARVFLKDPFWFEKTFKNNPSDQFDLEGFDKNGYNREGFDRAGYCCTSYAKRMYYDVNDDHLDSGEETFLSVMHKYSFEESCGLYLIVLYSYIQYGTLTAEQEFFAGECNEEGKLNYY